MRSRPFPLVLLILILPFVGGPLCAQTRRPGSPGGPPPGVSRAHPRVASLTCTSLARLPASRTGLAAVAWRDRVYITGGKGSAGVGAEAWVFDPCLRRFDDLPPMRVGRSGHAAVVCGNRILVFGGTGSGKEVLDSMEALDLEAREWRDAGKMPVARTQFGLAVCDGRIWIAGGSSGRDPSRELHACDPHKGTWERKADLPQPRVRLALVALHGDLYAIGGEGPDGRGSTQVWRYVVKDDAWKPAGRLRTGRRNAAAVRLGNHILVAGGWDHVEDEKVWPSAVEVYDARKDEWTVRGHLEGPRDGCRAVAWRGRALVFGGFGRDLMPYVEEVQWRAPSRAWSGSPGLTLVSLREVAGPAVPLPAHLSREASLRRAIGPFLMRPADCGPDLLVQGVAGVSPVPAGCVSVPASAVQAGGEGLSGLSQLALDQSVLSLSLRIGPPMARGGGGERPPAGPPQDGREGTHPERSEEAPPPGRPGDAGRVAAAMAAFREEMLWLMTRAYRSLPGGDPASACFLDDSEIDQAGDRPVVTVFRVPLSGSGGAGGGVGPLLVSRDEIALPGAADLADLRALQGAAVRSVTLEVRASVHSPPRGDGR